MDRTTPSKVDKADTSLTEGLTAQTLVARSKSKASDDAPVDDDLELLNFVATVSWIGYWTSFLPQKYWPDPRKPDGPISKPRWFSFHNPDADLAISIFSHENVEGDQKLCLFDCWESSISRDLCLYRQ
jgi:hypothetical protein